MRKATIFLFLIFSLCLGFYGKLFSQEIVLDKGIKAGKLDCFPIYGDEKTYYYLPAHPRLATVNGKPQFSFIKYVQNVPKGQEGGTTEGKGGGLVHFLVEYGTTDDERAEAEQELQSQVPGARLAGPVIYRSGTFALVTSFTKENGELAKEIVGLGKAPIMEGHKASVSMHLSQKGATLLWESFRNPTSQISVTFEMEARGYRKPYEARIEADWEKISKSDRVAVGAKYKWIGADIDLLFQDLRKTGGIKVEVKGENKDMDKIWQSAFNILMEQMFEKDSAGDALSGIQKDNTGFNNLDKATEFLKKEEERKKGKSSASASPTPQEWPSWTMPSNGLVPGAGPSEIFGVIAFDQEKKPAEAGEEKEKIAKAKEHYDNGEKLYLEKKYKEAIAQFQASFDDYPQAAMMFNIGASYKKIADEGEKPEENYKKAIEFYKKFIQELNKYDHDQKDVDDAEKKISEIESILASKPGTVEAGKKTAEPEKLKELSSKEEKKGEKPGAAAKPETGKAKSETKPGTKEEKPALTSKDKPAKAEEKKADKDKEGTSGFAIIASYRMKRIKQSGKAVINLNQWRQEPLTFRFDENVGGLSKYLNDPNFFRAVNLDDPVYKQREIVVVLDGQDSSDFTKYINYVTVQIRKNHESGEMTHDELKIDKSNFNQNSNNFMMIYGWKGDNDRTGWLTYQYKTRWSFYGGVFTEEDWTKTDDFVITVTPPHKYRKIVLEADPDVFKDREVRDASIKFYYNFYGKDMVEQSTLKANENIFSKQIEYAHSEGNFEYEYEITWHLRGGRVLMSGRLKASSDVIYCDELPEATPTNGR